VARIIAIANQKGGVGKTTTACNLSAALATRGKRVLLVDLDPQGNATQGLGCDAYKVPQTVHDLLTADNLNPALVMQDTDFPTLKLLPSNVDLAGAEIVLSKDMIGGIHRLRKSLRSISDHFDFIFVDCGPSLGVLTLNALVAATDLIIPIQAQNYALKGVAELNKTVIRVAEEMGTEINLLGVLITQFQQRVNVHSVIADQIREYFGPKVFSTVITHTVKIQESDLFGKPVIDFRPGSKVAEQYIAVAEEILNRVQEAEKPRRGRARKLG